MNGYVSFISFFINIIGNFIALMPLGMFMPLMSNKINKFYKFLILMILIVVIIEFLQFITLSGSCDIDDLILNVTGASIVYFICKIKFVNKVLNNAF
jgi:glycopeptide antibiotics resistance protein